jgi:hypothetical protein
VSKNSLKSKKPAETNINYYSGATAGKLKNIYEDHNEKTMRFPKIIDSNNNQIMINEEANGEEKIKQLLHCSLNQKVNALSLSQVQKSKHPNNN